GRETIDLLSKGFPLLGNVAEVRSLTQPLGRPLFDSATDLMAKPKNPLAGLLDSAQKELAGLMSASLKKAKAHYVTQTTTDRGIEYVTRMDVVLKTDPFEPESIRTLSEIETWLRTQRPQVVERAECYGVTVHARDVESVVERDRTRVNGLVLAGVFLILVVLVRKPWLALYLLVTLLFSYYATLAMTTLFATSW